MSTALTHSERGQRNRGTKQIRVEAGVAEMTFEEIAARLGSSKQCVFAAYRSGMNKIKRQPQALAELQQLVAYRNDMRAAADFVEVKR